MLEMLKFNGARSQSVQEQTGALHLLVTRAEAERASLQSALDLLARGDAPAVSLGRQVQDASEKATALGTRLDELHGTAVRAREPDEPDRRTRRAHPGA